MRSRSFVGCALAVVYFTFSGVWAVEGHTGKLLWKRAQPGAARGQ